jgi:hypothetical protein
MLASIATYRAKCKEPDARQRIEPGKYREIKNEQEEEIAKPERKLVELETMDSDLSDQIRFCFDFLETLPKYYQEADLKAKQHILGSILSEKLVFEENSYRTIKFKAIISLVCRPGKAFTRGKKEESSDKSKLSNVVPHVGELSNQLKEELQLLYRIKP